jgi:hypothetical protein
MTDQQNQALSQVLAAILDAIKGAGPLGAPGGALYAALMGHGCTLEQFETLMGVLLRMGKVRKSGDLYFVRWVGRQPKQEGPTMTNQLNAVKILVYWHATALAIILSYAWRATGAATRGAYRATAQTGGL